MTTPELKEVNTLNALVNSYIVTHGSPESSGMNPKKFEVCKSFTKTQWNFIRNHAPEYISKIMLDIERNLSGVFTCKILNTDSQEIDSFLQENVCQLFQKLAKTLESEGTFGKVIPTDLKSYMRLKKNFDDALCILWNTAVYPELFPLGAPMLNNADEIRSWMLDSKNALLLNRITRLNLSGCKIKIIPPEIQKLTQLESIHLENNEITNINYNFGHLLKLKRLYLNNNLISTLPRSLGLHRQLISLDLSSNRLCTLPDTFSNLINLKVLCLDNNRITIVPMSICGMHRLEQLLLSHNKIIFIPDAICQLKLLKTLHLKGNQISSLPASMGWLESLKELVLSDNKIKDIPDSIANLERLTMLFLNHNKIEIIPKSICCLSSLTGLALHNNLISNVPNDIAKLTQLTNLHIENNQISVFPGVFEEMPKLKSLNLNNNPLLFSFCTLPTNRIAFIMEHNEFKKYEPKSCFSHFMKLLALYEEPKAIEEVFWQLKPNDQLLIQKMAGNNRISVPLLRVAVREAVLYKFRHLTPTDKEKVYEEVYGSRQPMPDNSERLIEHAFDNILLLIDTMDNL